MKYLFAFLLLFSFSASAADPGTIELQAKTQAANIPSASKPEAGIAAQALLRPEAGELLYGDPKAPVVIVEYASLSCGHCAEFYTKTLPELKTRYLDTGKALLVYRHFPLNAPALKAAQLVACVDEKSKPKFIETLFKTQSNWAFDAAFEDRLKAIARVGGMSEAAFQTCMSDKAIEKKVLDSRLAASKELGVTGTPTFFVGGRKADDISLSGLSKEIEKTLPKN